MRKKKKSLAGVVLQRRKRRLVYYKLFKYLSLASVLIFCFASYFSPYRQFIVDKTHEVVATTFGFKLEKVNIEGRKHTNLSDILATLPLDQSYPILQLDISLVRRKIEEIGWVERAIVERRLPNSIYIAILEREPVSIWQNSHRFYLIDKEGVIITEEVGKFSNLLHVVGKGANIYAIYLLNELNKHPLLKDVIVSAVRYGDRRWNLILNEDITVKLPEKEYSVALQYLENMLKNKKLLGFRYKTLDMRSADKYFFEER